MYNSFWADALRATHLKSVFTQYGREKMEGKGLDTPLAQDRFQLLPSCSAENELVELKQNEVQQYCEVVLKQLRSQRPRNHQIFQPRPKDENKGRDIYHIRIFSNIPKRSTYQQGGRNKVKMKDLKPKRIKDYLECKISQKNLNQPRKSAQAGPVVSGRDIPFVIPPKQIIEAPR
ncbi:hypothetical protein GQ457_02G033690 [Hibiscus cannabinus]